MIYTKYEHITLFDCGIANNPQSAMIFGPKINLENKKAQSTQNLLHIIQVATYRYSVMFGLKKINAQNRKTPEKMLVQTSI